MPLYTVPDKPAYWLILSRNKVLRHEHHGTLIYAHHSELSFVSTYIDEAVKVGEYHDTDCFVLDMQQQEPELDDAELIGLREAMMAEHDSAYNILARAWQVALFLRTHRYCGQCGSEMQRVDWELATVCHRCQHRCYPRISPCIIVAIKKQNQLLLAKGRHHKQGMYSILAGFVESGESLEQAVHREVMEEVGIKIKSLRYFDSQPWPFPHSLMVGFLAEYDSGEICVDGEEILEASWYKENEFPLIPPEFSIAGRLITAAMKEHDGVNTPR
ncbi:NAD(+) diphosphatase [Lacimicrobium sp. SS2-24]|uniref:NAD(+) diphosphatase n=1 Tax=Lacimicrobium sp. SS2-24 TaxID=2005569 RepID=UPI000B4B3426|nr:NAD(+) diphosphatase [Lacimicrobium sp. SS2-24]